MVSKKMEKLVQHNSVIREMFEEGKRMMEIYGEDDVYDFSIGNPSVPVPEKVKESIKDILDQEEPLMIHGYMNNQGFNDVRKEIASSINKKHKTCFNEQNIIMTVGAASGLNIVLKSILNPGDEVLTFAPYFMEYRNYVENYDGKLITIFPNSSNFEPNLKELEETIHEKTKAIIINTPNNPTGLVYSKETISKLANILSNKEQELGHPIFLISDEPYRELVYDNIEVPYITPYYKNTFIVYSYSKSLSIPGERIGYVVVPNELDDFESMVTAITIANRIIGCVNAPSLFQRVIMRCANETAEIELYNKNRKLLYNSLIQYGYQCIRPQGAFYLFVKSPIEDDKEFCNIAKKYHLLFVPGSSFGYKGYVRIAYCTSYEKIQKSLKAFEKLAKEFGMIS